MRTVIDRSNDDGLDNGDGTGFCGVSGPILGCLSCHSDVTTRWDLDFRLGCETINCADCMEPLAEEVAA